MSGHYVTVAEEHGVRNAIRRTLRDFGGVNINFVSVNDVRRVVLTFTCRGRNFLFGADRQGIPTLRDWLKEKIAAIRRGTASFEETFGPYMVKDGPEDRPDAA